MQHSLDIQIPIIVLGITDMLEVSEGRDTRKKLKRSLSAVRLVYKMRCGFYLHRICNN